MPNGSNVVPAGRPQCGGGSSVAVRTAAYACLAVLAFCTSLIAHGAGDKVGTPTMRISVVYNNVPHAAGFATRWGFAAVVQTPGHTVLFDTGGEGTALLANMERLGIRPEAIDTVVLSHPHADHTGGLTAFLRRNPNVSVYLPASSPASLTEEIRHYGAKPIPVHGPTRIVEGMHSTGELGDYVEEQALVIDTPKGLVVITGCAHPGIVEVVAAARRSPARDVYLVMGGFHMLNMDRTQISRVIARLEALGVERVAPSHCTGDTAMAMFRQAWGKNFIDGGAGAIIEIPLGAAP